MRINLLSQFITSKLKSFTIFFEVRTQTNKLTNKWISYSHVFFSPLTNAMCTNESVSPLIPIWQRAWSGIVILVWDINFRWASKFCHGTLKTFKVHVHEPICLLFHPFHHLKAAAREICSSALMMNCFRNLKWVDSCRLDSISGFDIRFGSPETIWPCTLISRVRRELHCCCSEGCCLSPFLRLVPAVLFVVQAAQHPIIQLHNTESDQFLGLLK